jgi:multidrug efflux pump subunit AcrA (membrane-fusion protein)
MAPGLDETGDTWREIDALVDEIAELARSGLPLDRFATALLQRTVTALAAPGGAFWVCDLDGAAAHRVPLGDGDAGVPTSRVRLVCHVLGPVDGRTFDWCEHERLAEHAVASGAFEPIPPGAAPAAVKGTLSDGDERPINGTSYPLYFAPIALGGRPVAVLEIVQRNGLSPAAQRGNAHLLAAVCELAGDYFRDRRLAELDRRDAFWRMLDGFAQQVHQAVDLDEMAYRLVSEGRRLIGCDRLTLLLSRGRSCQVSAVSGVDVVERKARSVVLLERFASPLIAAGETVVYSDQGPSDPSCMDRSRGQSAETELALHDYLDESPVRVLILRPIWAPCPSTSDPSLASPTCPLGALVAEHYSAEPADHFRPALEHVVPHAAAAVAARLPNEQIPFLGLWRRLAERLAVLRLPRALLLSAGFVAIPIVLWTVPAEFTVEAEGELQPSVRRDIFAPADGLIAELMVNDAEQVNAGETLAVLRQTGFDLEVRRVEAELGTVSEQLAAVQAARLGGLPQVAPERLAPHELSAREEELRRRLAGLQEQMKVLRAAREEQILRSPIAGQVITWDVRRRLEMRPVSRGQVLLTVADLSGPWVLELQVPDRRIGHLFRAQEQSTGPLKVEFLPASNTQQTLGGHVEKIAPRAESEGLSEPIVPVTVAIDSESLDKLRPGTLAVARVHCGMRAVGYVWFSELWDNLRRWLF